MTAPDFCIIALGLLYATVSAMRFAWRAAREALRTDEPRLLGKTRAEWEAIHRRESEN